LAPALEGDDWERFCVEALEDKYDPRFQQVPARFRGDYGIDGFVAGETLFQCYGDESGSSASERSKAQRRKLRDDIPKLRSHAAAIGQLVGTGVKAYVLLVSVLQDKAVVEAARNATEPLRKYRLDYLDPEVEVLVKDHTYLKEQWDKLYGAVAPQLKLPEAQITEQDVEDLLTC
jgi:hypothetical protein